MTINRVLWFIVVATAHSSSAGAAPCGEHEPALRAAKLVTWPDLYRRGDTQGLAAFLTKDFVSIAADGTIMSAAQEIAWLTKHPWQPQDFTYTISWIDCPAANVAVIAGQGRSVRSNDKGETIAHSYASSNLFVLEDGRWRPAMSHVSGDTLKPE